MCAFLLEFESATGFLTFYKNCIAGENQALELWSKNLTNQNVGFFKLQYLTNDLRYDQSNFSM